MFTKMFTSKQTFADNLLRLDLQTFAGEEGGGEEFGAYDPGSAYEGIQGEEGAPPAGEGAEGGSLTDNQPEPTPAEPEYLDFGGRKVPASEELKGLHKDYVEQQRYITSMQDQMNAYKQLVDMTQNQTQNQNQQPQAPQDPTQEVGSEQWWEKFYENPKDMLDSYVQGILDSKVGPLVQEKQWQTEVQMMHEKFSDFGDYASSIQQVLNDNPYLAEREGGLEDAYYRAKSMHVTPQPSPEQLLNDPNFVQSVLSNEQIRNQMLNQYMQTKNQRNTQVPPVMGNNLGGYSPQTPQNSPTSLREASRQFRKSLGY